MLLLTFVFKYGFTATVQVPSTPEVLEGPGSSVPAPSGDDVVIGSHALVASAATIVALPDLLWS